MGAGEASLRPAPPDCMALAVLQTGARRAASPGNLPETAFVIASGQAQEVTLRFLARIWSPIPWISLMPPGPQQSMVPMSPRPWVSGRPSQVSPTEGLWLPKSGSCPSPPGE